ncbi:MAG: type IV secretion system DNA-binding domain-containing protein [bacterium]|nr:type IV secretion system DNA-binding domain-containing protein [bacterium]
MIVRTFNPEGATNITVEEIEYDMTVEELYQYLTVDLKPFFSEILIKILWIFICSMVIYILFFLVLKRFKSLADHQKDKEFIRGAKIENDKVLKKRLKKEKVTVDFNFGGIQLPTSAEPQHVFFVGAPGTGKTVFLNQIIERIIERNDPAIVYDFKGDFVTTFYRENEDHLFNPKDKRCVGWNIFNDIKEDWDINAVSESLIPPKAGKDPFWNMSAGSVLAGILRTCIYEGKTTNKDIDDMLRMDLEDLVSLLSHTPENEDAVKPIIDHKSKMAQSVVGVMSQYTRSLKLMRRISGDFSINKWIKNPEGNIFITNYSLMTETLKPILSLFIDLISREILALSDNRDRRIFLLLDEFGTLQQLQSIVKLLTLGRSKGASVWPGIQDIGQIENIYSREIRQAIVNACRNSLILSVNDPTTAKFLSDKIGEYHFEAGEFSSKMGVHDNDGVQLRRTEKIESLVLSSELTELPNLEGYVKIAGYPIVKTKLGIKDYDEINEAIILTEDRLKRMKSDQTESDQTESSESEETEETEETEMDYF